MKGMRWFGIPAGLGIACLAALQLERTVRRERRLSGSGELANDNERWSWQVCQKKTNHYHILCPYLVNFFYLKPQI